LFSSAARRIQLSIPFYKNKTKNISISHELNLKITLTTENVYVFVKHAMISLIVMGSFIFPSPLIQTCLRHCCADILSSGISAAVLEKNYFASLLMLGGKCHCGFFSFSK
jgi:hypothetical protein